MWRRAKPRFDSACALSQGGRDTQEDAVVADFPIGSDTGFALVADGMGGHSAGDIASRHVLTQLYAALKFQTEQYTAHTAALPAIMAIGLEAANAAIYDHIRQNPRLHGMGSTLICLAVVEARAHWLSVGDSPLYVFRGGTLRRLNQDHSLAHELDMMVKSGTMGETEALTHPDRSTLTSAITGGPIAQTDCPQTAFDLHTGDILLAASDGVQALLDAQISRLLAKHRRRPAATIAFHLMSAIEAIADPDQDNVSLSVIKVNHIRPNITRAQVNKPTFRSSRAILQPDSNPADGTQVIASR